MNYDEKYEALDKGLTELESQIEQVQKQIAESDKEILKSEIRLEVLKEIFEKL